MEWISVDDRPPTPEDGMVVVATGQGYFDIGCVAPDGIRWTTDGIPWCYLMHVDSETITHWMPLPPAPTAPVPAPTAP